MKKITALILTLAMLVALSIDHTNAESDNAAAIEQQVYEELKDVDGVESVEVEINQYSKEYLEEMDYNMRQTVYFGYDLASVEAEMNGQNWQFTVDENGKTVVQLVEFTQSIWPEVLKNAAIGGAVLLICVTVSVVTAGTGAVAVSVVFAQAAQTGAIMGATCALTQGATAAVVTAVGTDCDWDAVWKSTVLSASSGFAYGCAAGAVIGGITETMNIYGATKNGLTMNQVAQAHRDYGLSYDTLGQCSSTEELNLYKELAETKVNTGFGTKTVLNDTSIDKTYASEHAGKIMTNSERMQSGLAPIDPSTGYAYELHHVNQNADGILAVLTRESHRFGNNYALLHSRSVNGVHSALRSEWNAQASAIWGALAS